METQFAATDWDVDDLLSAIAHATNTLLQEVAAAEQHMGETNDECERLFEQRVATGRFGAQPFLHNSGELLAHHRDSVAKTVWEHHATQAHQFAAWWADAACIAVQAAAVGCMPSLARLVAADPAQALSDEAASQLPDLPERDRGLLRLAYLMSAGDGTNTSAALAPRCHHGVGGAARKRAVAAAEIRSTPRPLFPTAPACNDPRPRKEHGHFGAGTARAGSSSHTRWPVAVTVSPNRSRPGIPHPAHVR